MIVIKIEYFSKKKFFKKCFSQRINNFEKKLKQKNAARQFRKTSYKN